MREATVATPTPTSPVPFEESPGSHVLVWVLCDTELLEVHAVERTSAEAFMHQRLSVLSHEEVTKTFHPVHCSVVYQGHTEDRRPGLLQAYVVLFAPGSVEIHRFPGRVPRVPFRSDLNGQGWMRQVPNFEQLHDGTWDPADRDRWLAWAGFGPGEGVDWDFTEKEDGKLVASARAGVVNRALTPRSDCTS